MTDFVKLLIRAGAGGRGKVSFRREKYVPKGGPDGGEGGDGGDVIVRADASLSTLKDFAGKVDILAEAGNSGGKRKKAGARGENTIVRVPVGTQLRQLGENSPGWFRRTNIGMHNRVRRADVRFDTYEIGWESDDDATAITVKTTQKHTDRSKTPAHEVRELPEAVVLHTFTQDGEEYLLCQGGFGGHGNTYFKSSRMTTPRLAQWGTEGEGRDVELELKLLADIGLVGLPNAGKSTLLSVLTSARPKVANYPFTTLEANLGVLQTAEFVGKDSGRAELVVADIPGLIEGASQGKGLGLEFLRHVENCAVLLFVLYLEETEVYHPGLSDAERAGRLVDQYHTLLNELQTRDPQLLNKPAVVSINKSEFLLPEQRAEITRAFGELSPAVVPLFISAATKDNLTPLVEDLLAATVTHQG